MLICLEDSSWLYVMSGWLDREKCVGGRLSWTKHGYLDCEAITVTLELHVSVSHAEHVLDDRIACKGPFVGERRAASE